MGDAASESVSVELSGATPPPPGLITSSTTDSATPPAPAPAPAPASPPPSNILIKFGYKDVDKKINDAYIFAESNNSTICDIIAMYLKGQKILYTEAKTVCEQRLNYLMLPAILITAICTILSLVLKDTPNGSTIVSSLNGANAFLLALISYLKLDAKAEAHRTAAYKFDKLQSFMEFNSGRILFDKEASKKLISIIQETENNVRDIKETNQFILPEKIRYEYPKLCQINVFAEVKKIQNKEMILINKIKDYMNDILSIRHKALEENRVLSDQEKEEIKKNEAYIKSETNAIIKLKDDYLKIDEKFEEEMEAHRNSIYRRCEICGWLKS